jgi:anti-sigma-K factor RskA
VNEQEFAELAAGYALNALSPEDRAAFESARGAHPEWERWVSEDAATVAVLADGVAEAGPPLTLRSSLLSRVATMPQLPDVDPAEAAAAPPGESWSRRDLPEPEETEAPSTRRPQTPPAPMVEPAPTTTMIQAVQRRNWTRGLLALAACLVLLVTFGFTAATINEFVNRPPELVAMQQIEGAPDALSATAELGDGGSATALWSESVGKAVLISNGLPSIDDEQTFEVWFVRDDEPISAGTFAPNENGGATALLDGSVEAGDVIAVTVEPAGGSPTGEPSTDPIVAIPTS